MVDIDMDPPAEVEVDPARKALREARAIGLTRNLEKSRADRLSLKLGLLLREIKKQAHAENIEHISFETWVGDTFIAPSGSSRTLAWANKFIETATALEPWEDLVKYLRRRLSKQPGGCAFDSERSPCVTWWSCFEAVRLAKEKNLNLDNPQLEAGNKDAEYQVLEWAHLPVKDIRALIQDAKKGLDPGTTAAGEPEEGGLVALVDGKVDPNIRELFEAAMQFTCNIGGEKAGGIPYEEATVNQRVERLAQWVVDVSIQVHQEQNDA